MADDEITLTFLTNHKIPINELDPGSSDSELVEQAMAAADDRGMIQTVAHASKKDGADAIRRKLKEKNGGDD